MPHSAPVPSSSAVKSKALKRKQDDAHWKAFWKNRSDDNLSTLCVAYTHLVRFHADKQKRKLPHFVDVNDLVSAGNKGLLESIGKFDPAKKTRFETFCTKRVIGAMGDYIRSLDWVPRSIRSDNSKHRRAQTELSARLRREPTDGEIALHMKIKPSKLIEIKKNLKVHSQLSMDACSSDDSGGNRLRLEMLEDRREAHPAFRLMRDEIRPLAEQGLKPNEKAVLSGYYFEGKSMKQIGATLGLSESRVCQLHGDLLDQLRVKLKAYATSPTLE